MKLSSVAFCLFLAFFTTKENVHGLASESRALKKAKGRGKGGKGGKGRSKGKKGDHLILFYQWVSAFVDNNDCAAGNNCAGEYITYVGKAQDESGGVDVAMVRESCTRLQDGEEDWQCYGTYTNLYGYEGVLSYSGYYSVGTGENNLDGFFVITGGTGDFKGVEGEIHDDFNSFFQSNRVVTWY